MQDRRGTTYVLYGVLAMLGPALFGCAGSTNSPPNRSSAMLGLAERVAAAVAGIAGSARPLTSPLTASLLPPGMTGVPGSRGFDPAQARRLVQLIARCEEAGVTHQYERNGDELVVAIRGSKTLSDWMADLDAGPTVLGDPASRVNVHVGFYRRAMDILWSMERSGGLAHLRASPSARLKLTGHSLGGAVAQILGALVAEQRVPLDRIDIYSFGAPPFANEEFSARYGAMPIWRVETTGDTIPNMFNGPLARYRHVGTRVALRENGSLVVGEPGFYPTFVQRLASPKQRILPWPRAHNLRLSYVPRMALSGGPAPLP